MKLTEERLRIILNNILAWANEVGEQTARDVVKASGMTLDEAEQLDVDEHHEDFVPDKDLGLPTEARMEIDSCLADCIEDKEAVEEAISDFLSDTYGYCVFSYDYEIIGGEIIITNIEWDDEE